MYKNAAQKYLGACYLLVRKEQERVIFLGTAFLVHEKGYLLTAAHLLGADPGSLMVAKPLDPEHFSPLSMDVVHAVDVEVAKVDTIHNIAVLKLKKDYVISTPDHLLGNTDGLLLGSGLVCLGFPFGHQDLHNLAVRSSILSSKTVLSNGTKLLLFDSMIHDGMSGGPVVSIEDERVVGIVIGRFSPMADGGDFSRGADHPDYETSVSYAVVVEYGTALLEELGIEVI